MWERLREKGRWSGSYTSVLALAGGWSTDGAATNGAGLQLGAVRGAASLPAWGLGQDGEEGGRTRLRRGPDIASLPVGDDTEKSGGRNSASPPVAGGPAGTVASSSSIMCPMLHDGVLRLVQMKKKE
jgi:hypothetical protein